MIKRMLFVFAVVIGLLSGSVLAVDAALPWLAVRDANNNSLPVIGFGGSSSVMYVRVMDPVNNVPVPLAITRKDGGTANDMKGLYNDTYFSLVSCSGDAYHKTFGEQTDKVGTAGVTGFAHTVAPCNGAPGNQCLWASSILVTANAAPDPLASKWSNGACTDGSFVGTSNLRQAVSVLDLTVAHPPPYTMAL